jgi:signal transduction histidine kinase
MFRSATFKLTAYYLAIIAAISISFSGALYHVAVNDLAGGLQRQTQRISDNFPVFSDSPYLRMGAEFEEGRKHLIGRLIFCNILVLVGAGFASYALARRTLEPIESAHERQKRFTADVSHELRTPLTALKMESEVALLDPNATKADLKAVVQSNVEEVEKLTLLVGNLLKLSQLDDNYIASQNKLVLQDVVSAAVKQVQTVASDRGVQIIYKPTNHTLVRGEESTLTQLFVILLDNAVKYGPNESTVTVTDGLQASYASIAISDTGNGIAKADLEHVFERFYRADNARTSSAAASGFGLGLSIAKLIADSHRATITLKSKIGRGTTATVFIPAADQPPAKQPSQA